MKSFSQLLARWSGHLLALVCVVGAVSPALAGESITLFPQRCGGQPCPCIRHKRQRRVEGNVSTVRRSTHRIERGGRQYRLVHGEAAGCRFGADLHGGPLLRPRAGPVHGV